METLLTPSNAKQLFVDSYEWESAESWKDWFSDDPSVVESSSDLIPELMTDCVSVMLENSEFYWEHPGWIEALRELFEGWLYDGRLIRARLFAEWILEAQLIPSLYLDPREFLSAIAAGNFCEAFPGISTSRLNDPEYYRLNFNFAMVRVAEDDILETRASARTLLFVEKHPEIVAQEA